MDITSDTVEYSSSCDHKVSEGLLFWRNLVLQKTHFMVILFLHIEGLNQNSVPPITVNMVTAQDENSGGIYRFMEMDNGYPVYRVSSNTLI